jgi:arsenate reductase
MKLFGIKNCDMTQKARKFLDKNKVEYEIHDYKESGINAGTLKRWLKHIPLSTLLNSKSTTYRSFTEAQKAACKNEFEAIQLMIENTSVIKRPLLEYGRENFLVGFKEEEWKGVCS